IWVDAICINQDYKPEKNRQVEMMADIYGRADCVRIWLGDLNTSSKLAILFIKQQVLQLDHFDDLCRSSEFSEKWKSLLELMQREWFSRRWVVQEVALAPKAIIHCGPAKLSWSKFAVAVELFVEAETATHRLSELSYESEDDEVVTPEVRAKRYKEEAERLFKQTQETPGAMAKAQPLLTLEYLVSSLSIFDVTNPHDSVYALLGISKDTTPTAANKKLLVTDHTQSVLEMFTEKKQYNVDYKADYIDICKEFIEFCVRQNMRRDPSRALDVICRPFAVDIVQKQDGLPFPSWIPRLSKAAYGMDLGPGIDGLRMGRENADSLVGLPNITHRNYNAAETKKASMDTKLVSTVSKPSSESPHPTLNHFSLFVQGFVLDTIVDVQSSSQSGSIPTAWANFAGWDMKATPPEHFWRTLVADRGSDGENPPVYYARACQESFRKGNPTSGVVDTTGLIEHERNSVVAQFCRRVQAAIWNRALVKTKTGRLGLVASNVREGDLVCILYGCSVPVILRQHG
ncbi:heterokaryon incompatibility protein-domain-containing protein, partial [Hyaloscypha finlandica]